MSGHAASFLLAAEVARRAKARWLEKAMAATVARPGFLDPTPGSWAEIFLRYANVAAGIDEEITALLHKAEIERPTEGPGGQADDRVKGFAAYSMGPPMPIEGVAAFLDRRQPTSLAAAFDMMATAGYGRWVGRKLTISKAVADQARVWCGEHGLPRGDLPKAEAWPEEQEDAPAPEAVSAYERGRVQLAREHATMLDALQTIARMMRNNDGGDAVQHARKTLQWLGLRW